MREREVQLALEGSGAVTYGREWSSDLWKNRFSHSSFLFIYLLFILIQIILNHYDSCLNLVHALLFESLGFLLELI